jgi:hypothetical protein
MSTYYIDTMRTSLGLVGNVKKLYYFKSSSCFKGINSERVVQEGVGRAVVPPLL